MSCTNKLCDYPRNSNRNTDVTTDAAVDRHQEEGINHIRCGKAEQNNTNNENPNSGPIIPSIIPSVSVSEVANGKLDDNSDVTTHAIPTATTITLTATTTTTATDGLSNPTPTLYFANTDDWTWNYKGILLPKLTNDFKDSHLENAYQRYSHRQRQKSLVILNIIDIILKLVLLIIFAISDSNETDNRLKYRILYNIPWFVVNSIVVCLITCWKQFANNYLHFGALFTWIIFNVQGLL
jgi:hypothetical protein